MKRWWPLLIIGLVALARPVSAADLSYQSFNSEITVNTDASITVHETIVVDFLAAGHGIYRYIPYRYTTTDGGSAAIPLDEFSVTQDGQAATVDESRSNGEVVLKIGDPNTKISGVHTYVISYRAQAAVNFFTDHDELYWNVSGANWDQPLTNVKANVTLPSNPAATSLTVACYTGPTGSTASDCEKTSAATTATFSASTYLTVVVGWPKGIVTKPENFDALRAKADQSKFSQSFSGGLLVLNLLLPILALILMWTIWSKKGRDPKSRGTVIAQYDPPKDMRPAEVGVLMKQSASVNETSATIVDLAVRGYLRIEETEKPQLLGWGHKKDYALVELKTPDAALRDYEKKLLDAFFRNSKVAADGNRIKLSDFSKNKQSAMSPFRSVPKDMVKNMVERGYFTTNPTTARLVPLTIGIIFGWLGFQTVIMPGLILAGIIIIIFGTIMPKRTEAGVEALWVAKGFKEYLNTAEKYRLQWQEREKIFEKFLPYAMVLGVAKQWSEALAPYVKDAPDWYVGAPGSQFNAVLFYTSLSSFSTTLNTSAVSGAASGSSGFSGGFSGGGGGGGGGGGW